MENGFVEVCEAFTNGGVHLLQRYEVARMSRIGAGLQVAMGVLLWTGCCLELWGQRTASIGWVISAVHPDPTPSLGAPDAEFVALHLLGAPPDSLSLAGVRLAWNGHERGLEAGPRRPAGRTVVVHRRSDSVAFSGWGVERVALDSWPALVNGGAVIELRDSTGQVLDAFSYAESDLEGGGRPLLRRDPRGCGAHPNRLSWTTGLSPFEPTGEGVWSSGSSDALDQAEAFERVLPRGPGRLEWRLGMALDPVSRATAKGHIGGEETEVTWASDSAVTLSWAGRLSEMPLGEGAHVVRLGPLRGCRPGAEWTQLMSPYVRLRGQGAIEPVRLLADPWAGDPEHASEFVELVNTSNHDVDPSAWDWDGGSTVRRRALKPGIPIRFSGAEVQPWPGLRNGGGSWTVWGAWGAKAMSLSWGPCGHSQRAMAGQGLPLVREARRDAAWHTEGHPVQDPPVSAVGYGCLRDWTGELTGVVLHTNRPVSLMAPRWARWTSASVQSEWRPLMAAGKRPQELEVAVDQSVLDALEWPSGWTLEWGKDSLNPEGQVSVSCPSVPLPGPVQLRVDEILWHATDTAGEFVEVVNRSDFPVDLSGLQATLADVDTPFPSDWRTWVDPLTSLVLLPGETMAFGECPRWFAGPHPAAGPDTWAVESWSLLPNTAGTMRIRLPSAGLTVLDSLGWTSDVEGPWWWRAEDWAWGRGNGAGLYPMPNRASPGSPNGHAVPSCDEEVGGVDVVEVGGWPAVSWSLGGAGHGLSVGLVSWPEGRLLRTYMPPPETTAGQWVWNGLDGLGQPVRPGQVLLDVLWRGAGCVGRKRHRIRVPGYGG